MKINFLLIKIITITLINIIFINFLALNNLAQAQNQPVPHPLGTLKGQGTLVPDDPASIVSIGTKFESVISTIIGLLTIVSGLYFLVYFIIGGLNWITAGGKAEQMSQAQQKLTNGAVGLIIVVAAYSIVYIIGKVLGLNIYDLRAIIIDLKP